MISLTIQFLIFPEIFPRYHNHTFWSIKIFLTPKGYFSKSSNSRATTMLLYKNKMAKYIIEITEDESYPF